MTNPLTFLPSFFRFILLTLCIISSFFTRSALLILPIHIYLVYTYMICAVQFSITEVGFEKQARVKFHCAANVLLAGHICFGIGVKCMNVTHNHTLVNFASVSIFTLNSYEKKWTVSLELCRPAMCSIISPDNIHIFLTPISIFFFPINILFGRFGFSYFKISQVADLQIFFSFNLYQLLSHFLIYIGVLAG